MSINCAANTNSRQILYLLRKAPCQARQQSTSSKDISLLTVLIKVSTGNACFERSVLVFILIKDADHLLYKNSTSDMQFPNYSSRYTRMGQLTSALGYFKF